MKLPLDHARTLFEVILQAEAALIKAGVYFGHGTDNALDEAAYLVSHVTGLAPDFSDKELDKAVTAGQKRALLQLLTRRIEQRQPAAYLTHEAWFAGLRFYVDERVLIPRSPIAELIQEQFRPWIDPDKCKTVLDLGTGSGCIAIATALVLPQARVDATDNSADALAIAAQNVASYELEDRVTLIESDLFKALANKKYDLILSNPPYVDAQDLAALPEEYRHEPESGLEAGEDGLDLVIPMLRHAAEHLNPGGIMIVEVGNSVEALTARFPQAPFTWLEFEFGGHGVFLLDAQQIYDYHAVFKQASV